MNIGLRIPLTADQKQLVVGAVADDPAGLAAWARQVLLQAALMKTAKDDGSTGGKLDKK
jgi:hypothetical protein